MALKELNRNKAETGTSEKQERPGDPGPALTFIFAMLTMEFRQWQHFSHLRHFVRRSRRFLQYNDRLWKYYGLANL